ncbi:TPA: ead/Ea22-like family protein [Escherichia coli]|nr:ead/Ea22-like family protein [Escherichia coli]
MSKIDYQVLREAAVAIETVATPQKLLAFRMKVTPQVVLALLDERERNQQYIKRRDQENEDIALTVGKLRVELEAAKKRIAELEAEPVSQTYKLNELSGNYPVTPDSWISCSERMPNDKQYVWCWGKSYSWTECDTFEGYYDCSRNKWWAVTDNGEEPASKVTHWMPLPEPPQEAK